MHLFSHGGFNNVNNNTQDNHIIYSAVSMYEVSDKYIAMKRRKIEMN